jgi:hypothetical protein
MKRNFYSLFFVGALLLSFSSQAQHEEGQSNINVGIGFASFGLSGDATIPPISASYEYGLNDKFSVGAFLGYTASEQDLLFAKAEYTYFVAGARGSYHFELIDNFDTYAGLMVAYNSVGFSIDDEDFEEFFDTDLSGVLPGIYIGGRYHFTDNIGAFLEVGYGVSAVNLGLAIKFD